MTPVDASAKIQLMNDNPLLEGKQIVIAICGGVAAYKGAELCRLLVKRGATVRVVMTHSASRFIAPLTLQALSGHPVHQDLFDSDQESSMGHIDLARWADLIVVAPATAHTLAACRMGLAGNLLQALLLATTARIVMAPAMNSQMWLAAATQENINVLQKRGVEIIEPATGELACGEVGSGRLPEPAIILELIERQFVSNALQGVKITITAGPTYEAIDPVRYIGNRSSGKMGYAVAKAAKAFGATIRLVSGPTHLLDPAGVDLIKVESASEMFQQVMADPGDIFIGVAAVADYRPIMVSAEKIKKSAEHMTLSLGRNSDILAAVAALSNPPLTVGFAAETQDLERYAQDKLARKGVDMIAANLVGSEKGGFNSDQNALHLFWNGGDEKIAFASKDVVALELIKKVSNYYLKMRVDPEN